MPAPRLRNNSLRRIFRKVPGGRVSLLYKRRKPKSARCSNCKDTLKGVPREIHYKISGLSKTKRRPERPYGGVLCSKCMRQEIINKVIE